MSTEIETMFKACGLSFSDDQNLINTAFKKANGIKFAPPSGLENKDEAARVRDFTNILNTKRHVLSSTRQFFTIYDYLFKDLGRLTKIRRELKTYPNLHEVGIFIDRVEALLKLEGIKLVEPKDLVPLAIKSYRISLQNSPSSSSLDPRNPHIDIDWLPTEANPYPTLSAFIELLLVKLPNLRRSDLNRIIANSLTDGPGEPSDPYQLAMIIKFFNGFNIEAKRALYQECGSIVDKKQYPAGFMPYVNFLQSKLVDFTPSANKLKQPLAGLVEILLISDNGKYKLIQILDDRSTIEINETAQAYLDNLTEKDRSELIRQSTSFSSRLTALLLTQPGFASQKLELDSKDRPSLFSEEMANKWLEAVNEFETPNITTSQGQTLFDSFLNDLASNMTGASSFLNGALDRARFKKGLKDAIEATHSQKMVPTIYGSSIEKICSSFRNLSAERQRKLRLEALDNPNLQNWRDFIRVHLSATPLLDDLSFQAHNRYDAYRLEKAFEFDPEAEVCQRFKEIVINLSQDQLEELIQEVKDKYLSISGIVGLYGAIQNPRV